MSFYVGRQGLSNDTVKRQLHITANPQTIGYMQGGVQDDTVFHSDIKYLDYKVFDLTNGYNTVLYGTAVTFHPSESIRDSPCNTYYINDELYSLIHNNYCYSVYSSDGYQTGNNDHLDITHEWINGYRTARDITSSLMGVWFCDRQNAGDRDRVVRQTPSGPDFRWLVTGVYARKIIVWGISVDGEFKPLTPQYSGNEIYISSNSFTVGASDIYNLKHVSPVVYNSNDFKIREPSGHITQLVGSTVSGTGIKFSSYNGRTTLYKGNNLIIDSNLGAVKFNTATHRTISTSFQSLQGQRDGTFSKTFDAIVSSGLAVGDYCMCTVKYNVYGNILGYGNSPAFIFRFRVGVIQKVTTLRYLYDGNKVYLTISYIGDSSGNLHFNSIYDIIDPALVSAGNYVLPAMTTSVVTLR